MMEATKVGEPFRCFAGEAKPHEPFWRFLDAAEGQEPVLELDGVISEFSWYEDDVTPQMFQADLEKYGKGGPITIRLNSYGGDVIAASRMHQMIRDYPGRVTVRIDGVAASAATVVAVAGDRVQMAETAYFMIHDPSMVFFGACINLETMERLAATLGTVKEGIINAYESKTGLSRDRLSRYMRDESWFDAARAADLGFVDEVLKGKPKALQLPAGAGVVNMLSGYSKVPQDVFEALQSPTGAERRLTDEERREAESLRARVETLLGKDEKDA